MAINPNISLAVKGIELQDPLAQYGKFAAIQGAQQQNQLAQMQMQEYERSRAEEEGLRNYLSSANLTDPAARQGLMRYGKTGLAYGKALSEQDTAGLNQREAQFKIEKAKTEFFNAGKLDLSNNPSDANLTAYKEDVTNHALFNPAEKQQMIAGIDRILAMPIGERKSYLALSGATASERKPSTIQVNRSGQTDVVSVPVGGAAPTTLSTYADVAPAPEVLAAKAAIARAGAPNVNVSTEKKYGEAFGTKIAEADMGKMATAEKAPQLAESANRIIDLVKQGNVFTGPAADIKLNIARALNVAGADNNEKIANTEALIAATGQSTLDAIKSAGLGTGQGFTDNDLKFLQGIAGGTIGLTSQTLTRLAELQHKTATRAAEAWGTRVKQIPKEVLQGTGITTEPIKVPALRGAGPSVGVVQDGYRFKGGNPADAKSWEKI